MLQINIFIKGVKMLFCQHSSSDSGLFVGKLESDILGCDVVNEYILRQGDSFENTKFIVIDFKKHEAWLLDDEWIHFNVIRYNGSTYKPNIIIANSHYYKVLYEDYIDIINYRKKHKAIINALDL